MSGRYELAEYDSSTFQQNIWTPHREELLYADPRDSRSSSKPMSQAGPSALSQRRPYRSIRCFQHTEQLLEIRVSLNRLLESIPKFFTKPPLFWRAPITSVTARLTIIARYLADRGESTVVEPSREGAVSAIYGVFPL